MKRLATLMMVSFAFAGASCGGDATTPNPPQLWLGLAGDELHGRLIDKEPPPY